MQQFGCVGADERYSLDLALFGCPPAELAQKLSHMCLHLGNVASAAYAHDGTPDFSGGTVGLPRPCSSPHHAPFKTSTDTCLRNEKPAGAASSHA